jgi:hypothetical protein|tara:strand:+ start:282 stop:722 length:441 start_codon:yes stop_codon:yes gene_type:complete
MKLSTYTEYFNVIPGGRGGRWRQYRGIVYMRMEEISHGWGGYSGEYQISQIFTSQKQSWVDELTSKINAPVPDWAKDSNRAYKEWEDGKLFPTEALELFLKLPSINLQHTHLSKGGLYSAKHKIDKILNDNPDVENKIKNIIKELV